MRTGGGKESIHNAYFDWMAQLVCGCGKEHKFRKLLRLLDETEFIYLLDMDGNRADDGVDLRYRFAYETGIACDDLLDAPCSVLEMMVSLALRCEEQITDDPDAGDRTGVWFFEMVESLGLLPMDDRHFNKAAAEDILVRFMRRDYAPDGRGGLFTVNRPKQDMRKTEIWYQMMWYLNENIYSRERR